LRSGYGVKTNSQLAFTSYIESASNGVALAFNEIGDAYFDRDHWSSPFPVETDTKTALYYFKIGSLLDDNDSLNKYNIAKMSKE
jgi:TPR repeat protein